LRHGRLVGGNDIRSGLGGLIGRELGLGLR
jgi:hypothetical protein